MATIPRPPLLTIPRLPLIPDPLGRIRLPADLESVTSMGEEVAPESVGLTGQQVGRVWKSAKSLYRSGVHPALQLCVRRHGEVVLNRALGHARGNGPRDRPDEPKVPATPETPFCVFSTSKGITALVVHMLTERGALEIDQRVTDFIPEYGQQGKGDTLIKHLLNHRAAVPSIPRKVVAAPERLRDQEFVVAEICAAKPFTKPGTRLAYHAVTGGVILGEIVRRATGLTIRQVLAQEILDPLGFRWGNYGVAPEDVPLVGLSYVTGPPLLPPASKIVSRALSVPLNAAVELSNGTAFLTSEIPSASVVTTADELSRFFEIFRRGGELDGHRVMSERTLRRALAQQSHLELDLTLGFPVRYSYGLMLGAKVVSLYGLDTDSVFGHLGLINIMGYADPERGISVGLITSGKAIIYPEVLRFFGVMQTIAETIPKVPEAERPF